MKQLLDQTESNERTPVGPAKMLNSVLVFLPFLFILYSIWSVWHTRNNLSSPWLPEYTAYYVNGVLINFTVLQSAAIIPSLLLRWRKHYILSSVCIILFILMGKILQHELNLYPYFYSWG